VCGNSRNPSPTSNDKSFSSVCREVRENLQTFHLGGFFRSLFLLPLSFLKGEYLARCVTIFAYYSLIATNPFEMKDVGNCLGTREKGKIIRTLHNKIKFHSLYFILAFFVSIILSRRNFARMFLDFKYCFSFC
jgi:hypothetical protein